LQSDSTSIPYFKIQTTKSWW